MSIQNILFLSIYKATKIMIKKFYNAKKQVLNKKNKTQIILKK